MAIKLQVQEQLGGRSGFANAASVQRAVGTFGNVGLQTVNLPGEDVGGNISAILRTGQAQASAFQAIGKGLESISETMTGMAKAEDDSKFQQTLTDFQSKSDEVRLRNLDKAAKGEITYSQMADENKRELNDLSSQISNEANFNFGTSRDTLFYKMQDNIESGYVSDAKVGIEKIAEQKKQSFRLEIENLGDSIATGGIQGFITAQQKVLEWTTPSVDGKPSNPMITVNGADLTTAQIKNSVEKGIKTYLTNNIKANPQKFLDDNTQGLFEPMMKYMSEDEKGLYVLAAKNEIAQQQSAELTAFNKQSDLVRDKYALEMSTTGKAIPATSIMNAPNLSDQHKKMLIDQSNELSGNTVANQRKFNEIQSRIDMSGGRFDLVSKDDQQFYIEKTHPEVYGNTFKSQIDALKTINVFKSNGIEIPDGITNFIAQPPINPEQEKEWSSNILLTQQQLDPKSLNNVNVQKSIDIALRMKSTGEDYQTAKTNITVPENIEKLTKDTFNKTLWDKHSAFKEPQNFLSDKLDLDITDITQDQANKFQQLIKTESILGGTNDEIVNRAVTKLGLSNYELPNGKKIALNNAPIIPEPFKDQAKEELKTILNNNGIKEEDNYRIKPTLSSTSNKQSYYIIKDGYPIYDKTGDLVTFAPNIEKYRTEKIQKETMKSSIPTTSLGFSLAGSKLSILEHSYPDTLGKNKGILDAIWFAESGRGTSKSMVSSKGAQGHFQFIPDTAKQYGVNNPFDFDQSSTGAAKMMNDMVVRYNGNIDYALAGYNWGIGHVDSWIKKGAKFTDLPKETQDYITKVKDNMKG